MFRFIYINTIVRVKYNFQIEAERGRGGPVMVLLQCIPSIGRSIFRQYLRLRKKLTVGDQMYERPLLVTYPRSGTNWLRFIIESLSGKPTPGRKRLYSGYDYAIEREHNAAKHIKKYKRIILVIRDYRECIIRQSTPLWLSIQDVPEFLRNPFNSRPPSIYLNNIRGFDEFEGEKLLLYYEDLVFDSGPAVQKVAEFFQFDKAKTEAFIASMPEQKKASVECYHASNVSITKGNSSKTTHHADKHLSEEQKRQFDEYFKTQDPEIFEKYLKHYAYK